MKTISRSERTVSTRLFIGAAAIGLLLLAGHVRAVTLCASTAQELQDDLTAASDNGQYAGKDVDIFLVQGTYKTGAATGNGPFTYFSTASKGEIQILGGWSANCSSFLEDASLTVLDGKNTTQVLNIQNPNAEVTVSFLTIQNGESATAGGGVAINTSGNGQTVILEQNIIQNNHTASIGGGFAIDGELQLDAVDNLVVGNAADGGYGAGFVYSRSGNYVHVDDNTMYKNTTTLSGGTGGLYCCGTPTAAPTVIGNIFWQNTNFGIDIEGAVAFFAYNDYGTITGTTTPDSTNVSTDPKFIDAANGNYRLAGNSPLIGALPAGDAPASYDLAGDPYPYPYHGYFDIGAYEDTLFNDHGFETN